MKHLYSTVVFVVFAASAHAQTDFIRYKQDCDTAYRLAIDSRDFVGALTHLEKVHARYDTLFCEEYILSSYCYQQRGDLDKSAVAMRDAWSNYALDLNCLMQVEAIQPGPIMKDYNEQQQALVQEGYTNFGKLKRPVTDSLIAVFDRLTEEDQLPRVDSTLHDKIPYYDSLHLVEFRTIIYKFGYPGEWLLPGSSSSSFLLLTHSSYYLWFYEEMKPVFLEEVRKGHMPPSFYVFWLDRHDHVFKQPLQYGTLDVKSQRELTTEQKSVVVGRRLALGLITHFPIPSQQVTFVE